MDASTRREHKDSGQGDSELPNTCTTPVVINPPTELRDTDLRSAAGTVERDGGTVMSHSQPQGARSRHASGNNPNVRGIIIESSPSRDNSPNRSTNSAFSSPVPSPSPFGLKAFELPPGGGAVTRLSSSSSDYTVSSSSKGARLKTITTSTSGTGSVAGSRPGSSRHPENITRDDSLSEDEGRRYSGTWLRPKKDNQALLKAQPKAAAPGRSQKDVAAQSKEVLLSYMSERYSRDIMSPEGQLETLHSPEALEEFKTQTSDHKATHQVGRQLAAIGDEINLKYGNDFKQMTKLLNIRKGAFDIAYQAFMNVCQRLFNDGLVSWGRVAALLQFGYQLAIDVLTSGAGDFMTQIIGFLIKFITTQKISETIASISHWIAGEGGWRAALQSGLDTSASAVAFVTDRLANRYAAAVGALAAAVTAMWFFKPWSR